MSHVYKAAQEAGFHPQKEKAPLGLPQRLPSVSASTAPLMCGPSTRLWDFVVTPCLRLARDPGLLTANLECDGP